MSSFKFQTLVFVTRKKPNCHVPRIMKDLKINQISVIFKLMTSNKTVFMTSKEIKNSCPIRI